MDDLNIFSLEDEFIYDEDIECRNCSNCSHKDKYIICIQLNIENVDYFKHFVLDSNKYTPFHND